MNDMRTKSESMNIAGSYRLQKKLLLAIQIMLKEMEPKKKEAILAFLKGMMELDENEEKLYDERLAEFKRLLEEETN
jgi:hypothetical protein